MQDTQELTLLIKLSVLGAPAMADGFDIASFSNNGCDGIDYASDYACTSAADITEL